MQVGEQENAAVVRQAYAAFRSGDIRSVLALLHKHIDWEATVGAGSFVPMTGRRFGPAKVAEFFSILGENVEFQTFELREVIAQGDRVVALGYYDAIAKPTGRRFDSEWAMVMTVREGKITHFREHTDTASLNAAFASPADVVR
jgi:hypothetical protein